MRRRVITGTLVGLFILAVIGLLVVSTYHEWDLAGVVWGILVGLLVLGFVIRFIRAEPGQRIRETVGPILGAGDVYQKLLLGRPTADESLYEASKYVSDENHSSER